MPHKAINLKSSVASTEGFWNPAHVLTLNSTHSLKVATIKGEFIWHCHPDTDELFYCVSGGPMKLELNTTATSPAAAEKAGADEVVELKIGDCFAVPQNMQHRPVSMNGEQEVETGILLIEKVGTVNTGDREGDGRTVYVKED